MSNVPVAVLYYFNGSVWSAAAELTAIEKRFDKDALTKRSVNLMEGMNFSPSFLKISTKGTIPALVVPFQHTLDSSLPTQFKAITTSIEVCKFLDDCTLGFSDPTATAPSPSLSPATVQGSADSEYLIGLVHSDTAPDANKLLLGFRSEGERDVKWGKGAVEGGARKWLEGRHKALLNYRKESEVEEDPILNKFYDLKIKENSHLISIFTGKVDSTEYIAQSKLHWSQLAVTLKALEEKVSKSTYLIGDQISLADLHVGAFFARIAAASGAGYAGTLHIPTAVKAINSQLEKGQQVGPKLTAWAEAVFERESFKTVYKGGFH